MKRMFYILLLSLVLPNSTFAVQEVAVMNPNLQNIMVTAAGSGSGSATPQGTQMCNQVNGTVVGNICCYSSPAGACFSMSGMMTSYSPGASQCSVCTAAGGVNDTVVNRIWAMVEKGLSDNVKNCPDVVIAKCLGTTCGASDNMSIGKCAQISPTDKNAFVTVLKSCADPDACVKSMDDSVINTVWTRVSNLRKAGDKLIAADAMAGGTSGLEDLSWSNSGDFVAEANRFCTEYSERSFKYEQGMTLLGCSQADWGTCGEESCHCSAQSRYYEWCYEKGPAFFTNDEQNLIKVGLSANKCRWQNCRRNFIQRNKL